MLICMKADSDGVVTEAEVHDPGDEAAALRVAEAYMRLIDCKAPSSAGARSVAGTDEKYS